MDYVGLELFLQAICQNTLPFAPWTRAHTRKLPGVEPVALEDWLQIDEAYAAQMRRRDELIAEHTDLVHQIMPHAVPAAQELLDQVLALTPEIKVEDGVATRPNGVQVNLDRKKPMLTLGRLVQEDFLIHELQGDAHVLVAAILCFPASWTLAEKFGKSIKDIHAPVDEFDARIETAVERMFTTIRPEQPMKRHNALRYSDPELFHPKRGSDTNRERGRFIRSERQTLVRLPKTRSVVFSVHTYQVREENLTLTQAQSLLEHPIEYQGT